MAAASGPGVHVARLIGVPMRAMVTAAVLLAGPAVVAPAIGETIPGPVIAEVLDVIDGDTLLVRARIWLGHKVETRVRLAGVDAPELGGACARERLLARRARDFIKTRVAGDAVLLHDIRFGKYAGRVVARVTPSENEDLSAALLAAGLGRPYDGGSRLSWCDGSLRGSPGSVESAR